MPDRQAAKRIFMAALDLDPAERPACIANECKGDAHLQREVEDLFAAHDGKPILDPATLPAAPKPLPTDASHVSETVGTRIGPYKLLQQIGEGGFGVVFMADQEFPVRRRVALKIIKLGMDTRKIVARFEQERQALALMDHPNIAKVLDAGATTTGRPYFVMELVSGEPITVFCDRQRLSIQERLDLFVQVCQAIQHAHSKGLIHRDIKPSNVLVGLNDGRPLARVIDFGVAKATAAPLTEMTLITEHRQLIGTPQYMSPEQAEGSLDIDTRSDIYSLGVLLYELLTGLTPFDARSLHAAAFSDMQRFIRGVEPLKPSTRLSTEKELLPSIAARRQIESAKLTRLVRGDLDWIVMKCLEKNRVRRYETASHLALDLRSHLQGRPIMAAPPSTIYRLTKFVRRHRIIVAASVAIFAITLLGITAVRATFYLGVLEREMQVQRPISVWKPDPASLNTAWEGGNYSDLPPERIAAAIEAASIALAKKPGDGTSLKNLGAAQFRAGQYEDALWNLSKAVAIFDKEGTRYPKTLSFMAMCQLRLGRREEAFATLIQLPKHSGYRLDGHLRERNLGFEFVDADMGDRSGSGRLQLSLDGRTFVGLCQWVGDVTEWAWAGRRRTTRTGNNFDGHWSVSAMFPEDPSPAATLWLTTAGDQVIGIGNPEGVVLEAIELYERTMTASAPADEPATSQSASITTIQPTSEPSPVSKPAESQSTLPSTTQPS